MKILYGVPGEGMGHATRSKVIIAHLLKNHQVEVVSSSRAFHFLQKAFGNIVHEIEGFHLAYKNGEVSRFSTFNQILQKGPANLIDNFHKYRELRKNFMPDLIISDFESFSYYFAKYHKLPIISIDNMQVINRTKLEIEIPEAEKTNYMIGKNIIKIKVPGCQRYFITSFFYPPIVKEDTEIIPPIIRPEILAAKTGIQDHILVYQTSTSQNNLVKVLNGISKERFLVYGFNQNKDCGNVQLKAFSEAGFISDLANAKAVIANGGFSLISEAVYLKKPVCSVPLENQFEQFVNAAYIEKYGYGRRLEGFTEDGIKAFLYDLPEFAKNLQNYQQDGNKKTFAAVDKTLEELKPVKQ